jgi:hypothetical protein
METPQLQKYIYVCIPEHGEWEDIVIYLTEEAALVASDAADCRVEVYERTSTGGYKPTYKYIKAGIYKGGNEYEAD